MFSGFVIQWKKRGRLYHGIQYRGDKGCSCVLLMTESPFLACMGRSLSLGTFISQAPFLTTKSNEASPPPYSCCLMGHTSQVPLHEALTREQIQQAPGTGHFCWRQLRVLLLTVFFPSVDPCGYLIRTSSLNFTRGGFCDLQTKIGTDTKNHHTHHETSILCNIASLSEVFPQNIFKDMGNNTETCVDQNPINQLAST